MVDPVARYGFGFHNTMLRPSILGAATARKMRHARPRVADPADPDEAPRSTETEAKMREAIASLGGGETGAHAAAAVDDVIRSYRKDNAAGGLGVFQHLPLPNDFAHEMARLFDGTGGNDKHPAFDELIKHLEPSVRTHVVQQVAELMKGQPINIAEHVDLREQFPLPEDNIREAQQEANAWNRLGIQFADHSIDGPTSKLLPQFLNGLHEAVERRLDGRDTLDGGSHIAPVPAPLHSRSDAPVPLQGAPFGKAPWWPWDTTSPRQEEADPESDWFGPIDDSYEGPDIWRDRDAPLPPATIISNTYPVAPKFQPGAWRTRAEARSHNGKLLVDPQELTDAQRRNLFGRRWINPTGQCAGTRRLRDGYGYFGASRSDRTYHGGLDFPGDDVRMPTDARLLEIKDAGKEGHTLIFDLGNGMQMAMHHVKPSKALLDYWNSLQGKTRFVRSGSISAGTPLGWVDKKARDHVHIQIAGVGGTFNGRRLTHRVDENGQIVSWPGGGFVVDPTRLFGC